MNQDTKLLNCPFCGGKAEKTSLGMHSHSYQAIIFCKNRKHECGSSGTWSSRDGEKEALEGAIKAWNTRDTTDHDKLRAQLKAAEDKLANIGQYIDAYQVASIRVPSYWLKKIKQALTT